MNYVVDWNVWGRRRGELGVMGEIFYLKEI
jgi:hypothetical protein